MRLLKKQQQQRLVKNFSTYFKKNEEGPSKRSAYEEQRHQRITRRNANFAFAVHAHTKDAFTSASTSTDVSRL